MLKKTLDDLNFSDVDYLLTRYYRRKSPNDLDILVKAADYKIIRRALSKLGYIESSHDQALGGRLKNHQINLTKKGRIKIDLHRDFTWRKQKYLDTSSLWRTKRTKKVSGTSVYVPDSLLDVFLIVISIIFEKTYIVDEHDLIKNNIRTLKTDSKVREQADKYGYSDTFVKFCVWIEKLKNGNEVVFLPMSLVTLSYWERFVKKRKFDFVSFAYYFFFRARYFVNKTLPYD